MDFNKQREYRNIGRDMYHHRPVKNIIETHLKTIGDNWNNFLFQNNSIEIPKEEEVRNTKKSRCRVLQNPNLEITMNEVKGVN